MFPGFYCTDNIQCISKVCFNNTCMGKIKNEECNFDEDCHIGLFCSEKDKKSSSLLEIGSNFTRDSQCDSSTFCNTNNKKCTELEDGEEARNAYQWWKYCMY